jgi:hypothetical protein
MEENFYDGPDCYLALKINSNSFLMMTYRSMSLSYDDTSLKMFRAVVSKNILT